MKESYGVGTPRNLVIGCVVLLALASLPLLLEVKARTHAAESSVNIVNNSTSREIVHVYLSHVDADDWSGNQLGDSTISPGHSSTVSNFTCDQQQIKVIGEDQDGCFLSTVVTCGENGTWTITNETARDCGSN